MSHPSVNTYGHHFRRSHLRPSASICGFASVSSAWLRLRRLRIFGARPCVPKKLRVVPLNRKRRVRGSSLHCRSGGRAQLSILQAVGAAFGSVAAFASGVVFPPHPGPLLNHGEKVDLARCRCGLPVDWKTQSLICKLDSRNDLSMAGPTYKAETKQTDRNLLLTLRARPKGVDRKAELSAPIRVRYRALGIRLLNALPGGYCCLIHCCLGFVR